MAMIHLEPQTAQMFSRALGALKPPPNLTLSQWADNYRRLSAEASAAQGRWNTDNAPFQREIMDAIGDVHIRKVVAMMCAQSGKTDGLILNTIGYYMSYYPAPIMIVQPTVNLGESFSKDRLATMIRDTPVLRGLVDNKSRYSGNTIMKKNFAGGQLTIVGANAPTDLRGRPIKVLLADEVDAYKASAGKEGDPVMLAEQRQTTYWDYKTVLVSTPTDKNNSRILDEFNASTQEEWTVPCPNCGFYQPFVWDNMVFDKEKWPEGGVQYRCAECGCLDNEYRWKKNSVQGRWHAEHPERSVRGFHMNKIGSTLCGWDKIVEDFIAADLDAQRGDYEKMQVFVNTDLGLSSMITRSAEHRLVRIRPTRRRTRTLRLMNWQSTLRRLRCLTLRPAKHRTRLTRNIRPRHMTALCQLCPTRWRRVLKCPARCFIRSSAPTTPQAAVL